MKQATVQVDVDGGPRFDSLAEDRLRHSIEMVAESRRRVSLFYDQLTKLQEELESVLRQTDF